MVRTYSRYMASARPLRDVFSELAASQLAGSAPADADSVLEAAGHAELPDGLVAEAVVSYADTAPVEVAAHLSPYVMAHSPVYPDVTDPGDWLDVLATAPEPVDVEPDLDAEPTIVDAGSFDPSDLDFGVGDAAAVPDWSDPADTIDSDMLVVTADDTHSMPEPVDLTSGVAADETDHEVADVDDDFDEI